MYRKSDDQPSIRGNILISYNNQKTQNLIINNIDVNKVYLLNVFYVDPTEAKHFLVASEILNPIIDYNSIYSNTLNCSFTHNLQHLLISYSHEKLKQAFYSEKPEFEANINEFLDKEGDNFKTYSNKCLANSEKHSCLVKVNDKNRRFNAIIDGLKSHFTSLCVYEENHNIQESGDYDSIDLVEITKKTKQTKLFETTGATAITRTTNHQHHHSLATSTITTTTTTSTIQTQNKQQKPTYRLEATTTPYQIDKFDIPIEQNNLKTDSKINPPNVTGCVIIDDKQIEIKLYSESVVANNLYYYIEYKLDGANSSSSLSLQVKKNTTQVTLVFESSNFRF